MAGSAVRTAVADVTAVAVRAGSLVVSRGPILLALYLAGELARYEVVQVVGFVGAYTAIGGSLLFPFIILCRLVPLVAMLLVLRGGMPQLDRLAPLPAGRRERARAFLAGLLGGVLPFIAFYASWGYLREDAQAYYSRLLQVNEGLIADNVILGQARQGDAALGDLTFGPVTVAILLLAFGLRWAYQRWHARLPVWTVGGAVYLEALWVFLSAVLVSDGVGVAEDWARHRAAFVWMTDLRDWLGAQLAPLAWLWDAVGWLVAEVGGLVLEPLAWLVIAGVIYGQAVTPRAAVATVEPAAPDRPLVRRAKAVWQQFRERLTPIGRAFLLTWRAGPVPFAVYVLLYTAVLAASSWGDILLTRIIGPHPLGEWLTISTLVFLVVPVLIEPIRVSLVAGAYDTIIESVADAGGDLVEILAEPVDQGAEEFDDDPIGPAPVDQGVSANLANDGSPSAAITSSTNGPAASAGTRNAGDRS